MSTARLGLSLAFALLGSLSYAAQNPGATVAGVVRESSGSALPGVTVAVTVGGSELKAITDSLGHYSILLPAGSHTIRASLPGFCTAEQNVQVAPRASATLDFALKLGAMWMIDWVEPPQRLSELVASAHTVAYVRVTATEPAGACQQFARLTAKVLDPVKPPGLVAGADLTFWQEQWHSEPTPYPVGTDLVVLLTQWDHKLVRSHGPHALFVIEKGKVRESPFLSRFYRRYIGMPVAQFLAELPLAERPK